MIQKRLLLNKNIQLYQLASLLTPDGIVRYREIMKNDSRINSLVENSKEYWHELDNVLLCDQSPKFKFDPIDKYITNEMEKNIQILRSFSICKKTISDAKKAVNNICINLIKQMPQEKIIQLKLTKFYDKIIKENNENQQNNQQDDQMDDDFLPDRIVLDQYIPKEELREKRDKKDSNKIKSKKKSSIKTSTQVKNTHKNKSISYDDNDDLSDSHKEKYSIEKEEAKEELKEKRDKKDSNKIKSKKKSSIKTSTQVKNTHKNKNISYDDNDDLSDFYSEKYSMEEEEEEEELREKRDKKDSNKIKSKKKSSIKTSTQVKNTHKNKNISYDDSFDDISDFWNDDYIQKEKKGEEELNKCSTNSIDINFDDEMLHDFENESESDNVSDKEYDDDEEESDEEQIIYSDDETEYSETEEAKEDEAKKDESKKDESKKDESKKDESNKDEANKDEAKKETNDFRFNKSQCYDNQEQALNWYNIERLILENHEYFNMTKEDAISATIELNDLISYKFINLQTYCASAISPNSKFSHYWSILQSFEYENGRTFKHIAQIAFRLYPISASEAEVERIFSKLKWKFPDRRNRINQKKLINEIHIANSVSYKKIFKNEIESEKMFWQLPPHKENND